MTRPEESTPLVPKGFGAPKFLEDSQVKFLANEDENAYVQLEVFGDPAPSVTWLKGDVDLGTLGRFKSWTDGKKGMVFLGVENAQKSDEGVYRCLLNNRFGKREHKFKLFIARSWQERKGPPKRQVPIYWSEVPRSKFLKEGQTDKISFTAKLTVADKSARWTFNNQVCSSGDKYEVIKTGGNFTIVIKDPVHADTGCYRCTLLEADLSCETYLDVQLPDPEYCFLKQLVQSISGLTGRSIKLSCLSSPEASIEWRKDMQVIQTEDNHYKATSEEGEHTLIIPNLNLADTGYYDCRITKFGKEGADVTGCNVLVEEFPHKFSRKLAENLELTEREDLLLQVTTTEKDAAVTWYKDDKPVSIERKRQQRLFISCSDCTHQLKIEKVKLTDAGVYSVRTNRDVSRCLLDVQEYPYMLAVKLPPDVHVLEGNRIQLEVKTEEEEAEVEWFLNGEKLHCERSRLARIQSVSTGCTRTLVIKKCKPEDSGQLSVRTNKDSSETSVRVRCQNEFVQRLCDSLELAANSQAEFTVKVKDIFAPVHFFLDRVPLKPAENDRVEIESHGNGCHTVRISKVKISDSGLLQCKTPSNRGDEMIQCKCSFNVIEGESAPSLGPAEPVTCVAILHSFSDRMNAYIEKEQCRIVIPYRIEGPRLSTVDILVEKDGVPLEIGNEIQMRVKMDKIQIDVINPQRAYSGSYKVTMTNDQGSDSISVPVNIIDIPGKPSACFVTDIFKDSVLVNWKPPMDDGGCGIKHYIVENLDMNTSNIWSTIAMSDDGDQRSLTVRNLLEGHRYVFRVSAANKIGQSEAVETWETITTKDPWEVPSECGRCAVIDWMPTFADITWTAPLFNGGTPIISYIIQYREVSMRDWVDGGEVKLEDVEVDGDRLKGRCENLVEEYEYRFRVLATNRAGRGRPGPPSDSVIAMYKNIPPSVKEGNLQDMKIKEGRPIRFDVWIAGEPPPVIEWHRDDIKLANDDLSNISVYSKSASVYTLKNAVLSIPKALEESHSGLYKLRLKNDCGVFESVARVEIEGPPGRKKKIEEETKPQEAQEAPEEMIPIVVDRKLSDIKEDHKDEDKDSGLKIGEESVVDTEEESVWTEYSESEDEDFYEQQEENDAEDAEDIEKEDESSRKICRENNLKNLSNSTIKAKDDFDVATSMDQSNVDESDEVLNYQDAVINDYIDSKLSIDQEMQNDAIYENTSVKHKENKSASVAENYATNDAETDNVKQGYENVTYASNMNGMNGSADNFDDCEQTELVDKTNSSMANHSPMMFNGYQSSDQQTSDSYPSESFEDSQTCEQVNRNADEALDKHLKDNTVTQRETDTTVGKLEADTHTRKLGISRSVDNADCEMQSVDHVSIEKDESLDRSPAQYDEHEISRVESENIQADKSSNDDNNMQNNQEGSFSSAMGYKRECKKVANNEETIIQNSIIPSYDEEENEKLKLAEAKKKEEEELKEKIKAAEAKKKEEEELKEKIKAAEARKIAAEKEKQRKMEQKKKQHLENLKTGLERRLEQLGFVRSANVSNFKHDDGDSCLMSLLDQMNREDQDFKVWDREDYSFLRWFVTKQMETHIFRGTPLPFLDLIEGDPMEYVDKISEDNVPLDEIFLNAAASIFNKDIIIVPDDTSEDVRIHYGGPRTTKGKGSPLYLGCIDAFDNIPNQYYSIMPDSNCKTNFVYGETEDRKVSVITNGVMVPPSPKPAHKDLRKRSWKRMDSYTGSSSKDLDGLINEIVEENDMEELFNKLDHCETNDEDLSEEPDRNDDCVNDYHENYDTSHQKDWAPSFAYTQSAEPKENIENESQCYSDINETAVHFDSGENQSYDENVVNADDSLQSNYSVPINSSEIQYYSETTGNAEDSLENNYEDQVFDNDTMQAFQQSDELEPSEDKDEDIVKGTDHATQPTTYLEDVESGEIQIDESVNNNLYSNDDESNRENNHENVSNSIDLDGEYHNDDHGNYPSEVISNNVNMNYDTNDQNVIVDNVADDLPTNSDIVEHQPTEENTNLDNHENSSVICKEDSNSLQENTDSQDSYKHEPTATDVQAYSLEDVNTENIITYESLEDSNRDSQTKREVRPYRKSGQKLRKIKITARKSVDGPPSDSMTNKANDHVTENPFIGHVKQPVESTPNGSADTGDLSKEDRLCLPNQLSYPSVNEINSNNSSYDQNSHNTYDVSKIPLPDNTSLLTDDVVQPSNSSPSERKSSITSIGQGYLPVMSNGKLSRPPSNTPSVQDLPTFCITNGDTQEAQQNTANNTENAPDKPRPLKLSDIVIEDNPPEVKMRQRKYVRRKSTASFRWSGSEMTQVDGPPSCSVESTPPVFHPPASDTTPSPGMELLQNQFSDRIHGYGLVKAELSENKCRDSCLVSLLDQMSRSGDDFKVWDKDDHTFLQWYINKQMDIQISTGKAAEFLNLTDDHADQIQNQFDKSNSRPDEYFLRAFARIFNRDILLVGSERVETVLGGLNSKHGKGQPLLFGLVNDSASDSKVFYSLLPDEQQSRDKIIENLRNSS